jgi:glycosyltransferase involved in cell wall biosynthesis
MIKEGEPLPLPGWNGRLTRCGILSQMLADRSHEVIWWTSAFSHQLKKKLRQAESVEKVQENYSIHILNVDIVYRKNVSLRRIKYHKQLGDEFAAATKTEPKPDAIYCSLPTVDFAYEAVRYAKTNHIPVVVDVRDLWPDIFYRVVPAVTRPVARWALRRLEREVMYSLKNADVVTAVTPFALEWADAKGERQSDRDSVFFLGYEPKSYSADEVEAALEYWQELGINQEKFVICYFGNIAKTQVDFDAVLSAAEMLENHPNIVFVICGTGEYMPVLSKRSEERKNIVLPGYINQVNIQSLMSISAIGLLPYFNTWDFREAIPNKAIEYLAGGIPVLSELDGVFTGILLENECGTHFSNADELAEGVLMYYQDREMLKSAKDKAVNLFKKMFSADVVYGKFCDMIESLVKQS